MRLGKNKKEAKGTPQGKKVEEDDEKFGGNLKAINK